MIVQIGMKSYSLEGYRTSGRQIVPMRMGLEVPTVVGYLLPNGIVPRTSQNPRETCQIELFEERARESGLPILAEK